MNCCVLCPGLQKATAVLLSEASRENRLNASEARLSLSTEITVATGQVIGVSFHLYPAMQTLQNFPTLLVPTKTRCLLVLLRESIYFAKWMSNKAFHETNICWRVGVSCDVSGKNEAANTTVHIWPLKIAITCAKWKQGYFLTFRCLNFRRKKCRRALLLQVHGGLSVNEYASGRFTRGDIETDSTPQRPFAEGRKAWRQGRGASHWEASEQIATVHFWKVS